MKFFVSTGLLVIIGLILSNVKASPARMKRQGFNWGQVDVDDDNFNRVSSRRTSTTPASAAGTTTTTASPQLTACLRQCQATPEYNPVCGDDRVTYPNENRLRCAQRCGTIVNLLFIGACSPVTR